MLARMLRPAAALASLMLFWSAAHAAGIGYIVGIGASASHASLLTARGAAVVIDTLRDFPHDLLLNI